MRLSPRAGASALDGFDAFVAEQMKVWQVPGVALAVVRDGKVVLSNGYGLYQPDTSLVAKRR